MQHAVAGSSIHVLPMREIHSSALEREEQGLEFKRNGFLEMITAHDHFQLTSKTDKTAPEGEGMESR